VFWDEAVALDPALAARDERNMPLSKRGGLATLWRAAGLQDVEDQPIVIDLAFSSFDDYWTPFLGGQGPAGAYVASLSDAGRARATRLAQMLAKAGVTAIYATETDRARQTAEPLARALKLEVRTYSPRDAAGKLSAQILLDRLKRDDASGTVLVVGHQNTVPDLIAGLGHPGKVEIGDKDFDDLFVVVPKVVGPPAVLRLKY